MSIALVVRSLVAAARGDAAAAAAAGIAQLGSMFALNGGAKNALTDAREGIKAGKKGIAPLTLAGLVLAQLDAIEKEGGSAGARPADGDKATRDAAAAAFGDAMGAALVAAIDKAKADRKAAAAARAAEKGSAGPGSTEGGSSGPAEGASSDDAAAVGIDAALIRCAAFAPESLADALAGNEAARARLSDALALLVARDAAAAAASVTAAAAAAAAVVDGAKKAKKPRQSANSALVLASMQRDAAAMADGEKLAA